MVVVSFTLLAFMPITRGGEDVQFSERISAGNEQFCPATQVLALASSDIPKFSSHFLSLFDFESRYGRPSRFGISLSSLSHHHINSQGRQ
ncbi:hypothetical protein OBBRIDRAFT_34298 [Obba rivulosa]|uniref:Secreted protein n=1 Tax=Obba rivulosa TaxID=1052685 RepID=A0A8E2DIE5_9APHY|nr:hypothetical protein OBBRIDRAFT_34298 [Obba rivulosa]